MSSYLSARPQVLALLQQAKEHPEEDGPRLVLADFLEEQGDPDRADFIRLQCQLSPGAPPLEASQHKQIQQRLEQLEEGHGGAWLGSLWRWWLYLAQWHRGLLAVKLPRRVDPTSFVDVLPWIDTLLLTVSGRQSLQRIAHLLQQAQVNHLTLELHTRMGESALLEALAQLPESPFLRSLSIHWPIALLERPEGDGTAGTVAAVSDGFLSGLLAAPLCWHLSHLGSSRPFRREMDCLIRGLGVEPVHAEQRLWMHHLPPAVFQTSTSPASSSCLLPARPAGSGPSH
jgi:uncharacterized protein (TIGR02996 family)